MRMKTKRGYNGQAVVSTKDVVRFTEKCRRDGEGRKEGKREEDNGN